MYTNGETRPTFSASDFDGSNAAPLLIVGPEQRPELIERQDRLIAQFEALTEDRLSGIVDDDVIEFTKTAIKNRMHQREGENGMGYTKRLYRTPRYDLAPDFDKEYIDTACEASKVGSAALAQHALSATVYGRYHWEGKNITIVNDFRSELEAPMWEEVSDFVGVDARPSFAAMRKLKVHQFVGGENQSDPIRAIRIKMKRTIGTLLDGTVMKARTFAVINTANSSDFSQRALKRIYEASKAEQDVSQHPDLLAITERLVDHELPSGIALARNETVYGYNPKTEILFNQARRDRQARDDAQSLF